MCAIGMIIIESVPAGLVKKVLAGLFYLELYGAEEVASVQHAVKFQPSSPPFLP